MTPSNRDQFHFLPSHRPPFEDGDYRLTVTLRDERSSAKLWNTPPSRSVEFSVAGDRYSLHRSVLRSCFPPPGAHGDFQGVLPHVIFHRTTLPWERSPAATGTELPPWLALVCFPGRGVPQLTTGTATNLLKPGAAGDVFTWSRNPELADDPAEAVTVIDVERTSLDALLPTWEELSLTAHVRTVKSAPASAEANAEVARDDADNLDGGDTPEAETDAAGEEACTVLVARDLVLATANAERWVVHLVSLEACFETSGGGHALRWRTATETKVRLVSLFHWDFVCEAAKPDFAGAAKALDTGPFRLPEAAFVGSPNRALQLAANGSVPVPHLRREGGQSTAWVRGPLLPWTGPGQAPPVTLPLPARSSDALVLHERELGMADLSYATAWELGRMSALANRAYATRYATWKRARSASAARLRVQLDAAILAAPTAGFAGTPELPPDVSQFLRALRTLASVPATHLVPHPRLLPLESMRLVRVDTTWIECLLDGAQAIGRHSAHEAARDGAATVVEPAGYVGVLLRSALVEDHPDLEIHGWNIDDSPTAAPVGVVLDRKLTVATRLVLFAAEPTRVSLGLPPTVLHFGLDVNPALQTATVVRHSPDRAVPPERVSLTTSWGSSSAPAVLVDGPTRASACLDRVAKELGLDPQQPADFAKFVADLMESAPRVDFLLKGAP